MGLFEKYLEGNVSYNEHSLIAEGIECCPIMSDDEDELMYESAKILCSNGGSVLNVGFGMGIIDSYIREHNPTEHCIIEVHPQVSIKALEMGFNPIQGAWEEIIPQFIKDGKKFDSIYFDTFPFDYENWPQWAKFSEIVPKILKPNGIYSYFNEISSYVEKCEEVVDSFGWEKHIKVITFDRGDYNLIWYINK